MRNTSPDRAPRTSHKLVGSLGAPWPPIGATPPASYGGGRCLYHRWVLRRPNSGAITVTSARTVRTRRVAMPIGKVRPGHREATRGAANEPWKERSFQGRFAAPPHSADATTRLHDRRTGPDRCARPAAWSGRRCRLDRERGGPGQRRAGAGAASLAAGDDPRGQGGSGRPPGGCKRALERTFFSRADCSPPPGDPGPKAVLERTGSPIPCDEGEDLLKGGRSRGISGRSVDWRCIHAHFPVKESSHP